jgi:hypothetical protein
MKLQHISLASVQGHFDRGWRPGIKAVLFDDDGSVVLWRTTAHGNCPRYNFAGGGITYQGCIELPVMALLRELHEEVAGLTVSAAELAVAPVLVFGVVPTMSRPDFSHKALFIVGVKVPTNQLYELRPKVSAAGMSEMSLVGVFSNADAQARIKTCPHTQPDAKDLYLEALRQVA